MSNIEYKKNNFITLTNNITKKSKIINNRNNILDIPNLNEYNYFKNTKYSHNFLKEICRVYKLKLSGNKSELTSRIYNHLLYSYNSIIIQKYFRKLLVKRYFNLIGPALYNRSLCTNNTDFFSFNNIHDIPYYDFFSYKANDNSIWGFNIISIYNLFIKSEKNVLNPYNREKINCKHFQDIKHLINLNKIFNNPINIDLNNNIDSFSIKKQLELKCLELFQYIDELGNYTDISWFTNLNYRLLVKFIRELVDIWQYRTQLDIETKKQICHPYGDPFRYTDLSRITNLNFFSIQKKSLFIIEQFIKKGINKEMQNLGASYVLCALTLVSDNAANAMPWLYQSVSSNLNY